MSTKNCASLYNHSCNSYIFFVIRHIVNLLLATEITMDKTKEWELEMLMEKLRAKTNQFKSFFESAKALRMALLVSWKVFCSVVLKEFKLIEIFIQIGTKHRQLCDTATPWIFYTVWSSTTIQILIIVHFCFYKHLFAMVCWDCQILWSARFGVK